MESRHLNPAIILLLFVALSASARRCDVYLFSNLGCVDTVRVNCNRFDWNDFPDYDAAFLVPRGEKDGYEYIPKFLSKGEPSDGFFCTYKSNWRDFVSGDSLRIVMENTDSIGMRVIASRVIVAEPEDSSGTYRFFKPDMLTLQNSLEYDYLNSASDFHALVYSDKHYPAIARLNFHGKPKEIRLEPMETALVRASYGTFHIKRFRAVRKRPHRRRWSAKAGWVSVPLLKDDDFNRFSIRKFGFWRQETRLSANERDSLLLKPWLYLNLPATWIYDTGAPLGPWPSDIVLGLDISGVFGRLYRKAASIGIDYELVLSPFPTAGKAEISWSYGDLWTSEIYGLVLFDSNPFRMIGDGWITEHELSGKSFLGRRTWKYFPVFFRAGYGRGKTFHPSIYKFRFLENPDAEVVEGQGAYVSAGFELWFLNSALIRPAIEAGVAWGEGNTLSYDGEVISKSDSDDDNTFPFIRINIRP